MGGILFAASADTTEIKPGSDFKVKLDIPSRLVQLEMVYVEKGTFLFDAPPEKDENNTEIKKQYKIELADSFWIGRYPVTQAQWEKVMGKDLDHYFTLVLRDLEEKSYPPPKILSSKQRKALFFRNGDDLPMSLITWNEAVEFCRRLTAAEQKAGRLPADCRYSLPYDVQWMYAARGGAKSRGYKYSGGYIMEEVGWFKGNNRDGLREVGRKKPNELGIHDMSGTIGEMTYDSISKLELNAEEPNINPAGEVNGLSFNNRGGGFRSVDGNCLSTSAAAVSDRYSRACDRGFRIVLCKAWPGEPPPRSMPAPPELKLLAACAAEDSAAVAAALNSGADVNCISHAGMGFTPLLSLCTRDKISRNMVSLLLEKGADPNLASVDGMTPLHYAARKGRTDIMELLLANGAEIDSVNLDGRTPLHEAARYHQESAVLLLLKKGADPQIQCVKEQTPLNYAKHKKILKILSKTK